MKMILKSALTVAAMAGAAALVPEIAIAGVHVSIGLPGVGIAVGAPGYGDCGPSYYQYGPGYSPCEGGYYYEPIYFGGSWYHGPYRWRMERGEREFYVNGGWRRNEWSGRAYPASITFRNGGYYRDGRYNGWNGAERINARFHSDDRGNMGPARATPMRERPDSSGYRPGDAHDRGDNREHDDGPHNGSDGPHN